MRKLPDSGQKPLIDGRSAQTALSDAEVRFHSMENQLADVVNNAPIVVFALDSQGIFTLSEGMGLQGLGLKPGEVVGRSVFELYRDYPQILASVRRALAGETFASIEELPDLRRTYETKWTPHRNARGQVIGVSGVATDISERTQAEAVLRLTRERLTLALEASGICLWDLDVITGQVYLSEGWSLMLGGAAKETYTTFPKLFEMTHPEDRERILRVAHAVFRNEVPWYREEHRVRNLKGEWIWVESMGRVVSRGEDGRALRALGTNLDITKRKNTEEALRQSEEKYASMIRASPDAITLRTLPDCRYIDVNEGFTRMTGYSREEVIGKPVENLDLLPDKQKHATIIEKVLQSGEIHDQEFAYRTKSGEARVGKLSATRVLVGGANCVLSVTRDVTESKRAEEALRASEALFRTLVESLRVAVVLLGPDAKILFANEAALRLIGQPLESIVGKTSEQLGLAALREDGTEIPFALRPASRVLATGDPVRHAVMGWRRPGSQGVAWTLGEIAPVLNKEGKVERIVAAFSDVTQQKQVEEALRQSEEKYAKMIQFNPDAVSLRTYPDLQYLDVNKQWTQMFGYSREEALGKTAAELNIARDADRLAIVEQFGRGEEIRGKEVTYRTKSGESRLCWASAIPVEVGGQSCALTITRDITEDKRAEEALRKTQLGMQTMQKMEAVGRLAGGIAHDFNNMLMVVSGQLDLLRQELPPGNEHIRKIEQAQKAADRAAVLTRQLLAFSRMQTLQPQIVNLSNIVNEMNKLIQPLIGPNIYLQTKLESQLGSVKADPSQIEQVILNLVVNARDAMPNGGRLTFETANVDLDVAHASLHPPMTAGRYVLLEVSDTGIGMDAETQKRIFEPFFTTKPKGKGTGLGLASVYGVVKQSGGFIWVESALGRGTTFRVYLPLASESAKVSKSLKPSVYSLAGTETVLLTEDEPDVRAVAREFLLGFGYHVLEAGNGAEALEIAKQHPAPVHVLLTDMLMPGISGPELATQIAAVRPETKVVYMSGYSEYNSTQQGGEPDRVFVQKPFTRDSLVRMIRQVIDGDL